MWLHLSSFEWWKNPETNGVITRQSMVAESHHNYVIQILSEANSRSAAELTCALIMRQVHFRIKIRDMLCFTNAVNRSMSLEVDL